ncbi:hypothetical protein Adt_31014 [Abeliophyllum distichum]|uniref:Uncharacterized protein n=1 Tax=Abeliophyllum distichum TaxID=126358 RepID=A0ABD1RCV5_9LAMI
MFSARRFALIHANLLYAPNPDPFEGAPTLATILSSNMVAPRLVPDLVPAGDSRTTVPAVPAHVDMLDAFATQVAHNLAATPIDLIIQLRVSSVPIPYIELSAPMLPSGALLARTVLKACTHSLPCV